MATLTSPGVLVSTIDESNYLPAPTNSVPFVVVATGQDKTQPDGVTIAPGTLQANANKLYRITSQRDLVTTFGVPKFYTTSGGVPLQGNELNEYGLLAAYSALGATNSAYVMRADVNLTELLGSEGRPSGDPANNTFWLDTTNTNWGIYVWNATLQTFSQVTPIVITESDLVSAGYPVNTLGQIGDYAVIAIPNYSYPTDTSAGMFFTKIATGEWVRVGTMDWYGSVPTISGTNAPIILTAGDTFDINIGGGPATITVAGGNEVADVAQAINDLGWEYLAAGVSSNGKLQIYNQNDTTAGGYYTLNTTTISGNQTITFDAPHGLNVNSPVYWTSSFCGILANRTYLVSTVPSDTTITIKLGVYNSTITNLTNITGINEQARVPVGAEAKFVSISNGTGTVLADLGLSTGTFYAPVVFYGASSAQPLWGTGQAQPRPSGSLWFKTSTIGNGLTAEFSQYNAATSTWVPKTVNTYASDNSATNALDSTGGQAIPANTIYAQSAPVPESGYRFWKRYATGPTSITGNNTDPQFNSTTLGVAGPYTAQVYVSLPGSASLSGPYEFALADNTDAMDFQSAWYAAAIPNVQCNILTSGSIQLVHTEGGQIILNDANSDGVSSGLFAEAGFVPEVTAGVKYGIYAVTNFEANAASTTGSGTGLSIEVAINTGHYTVLRVTDGGSGYAVGDQVTFSGADLGGATPANDFTIEVTQLTGGAVTGVVTVSGDPTESGQRWTTQLSNWREFTYTPNEGAPVQSPSDGTLWYYSVTNQVDIMVNTQQGWRGYKNVPFNSSGFPLPTGSNNTDPNGPIISATQPTVNSEGDPLQYGDLWIDTSDLENYPIINRWQSVNGEDQWVLIDNADQTTGLGVVFADARWATNGTTNPVDDPIPTIQSLLTSNYLDIDAPSSSNYPVGILLFNTRRSGYNVKEFQSNYFNQNSFPDEPLPTERDAWVSVSGYQSNGVPYMGRKAQRNMIVIAMRASLDGNLEIRDEDNYFNLIACPNYPELQPNMILLTADRDYTAFVLGDTPMGLPDTGQAIINWATNTAGAASTGEEGLVTTNQYMGLFYPSGLTNDLSGNLVAVPPSHMMLRTFLRNDDIAYPWLAPAGVRRGLIENAASLGYLNRTTGEFTRVYTRLGLRDVLYTYSINPLVFFAGNGLLNFGNKSSYRASGTEATSALDRINVARLVAYVRRQLTLLARPFVFEPNDSTTRQNITGVVESLMLDLQAKRGIYDYLVVCDETNNFPARIDRNELWIDVAIEPVKAVEFIYIPVRIMNTGEIASTL
jgi:hypothetical protein